MANSSLTYSKFKHYFINCFLLLIPIFVWNIVFSPYLPEPYTNNDLRNNVPTALLGFEYFTMFIVFILTFLMPLKIKSQKQRIGLFIYLIGLITYLLAWREIILYPNGSWSSSLAGFSSIAYIPLIMLVAIGLIGTSSLIKFSFHKIIYGITITAFILLQTWHAVLIYQQII